MRTETLVILAKYWTPGQVKTRLAESLGPGRAAEISRLLLECSTARVAFPDRRSVLAYAPGVPTTAEKFDSAELGPWELRPQVEGDLGERMKSILREQFAAGSEAVVLLGADSPHLPIHVVEEAFLALQKQEVVLGPSEDGGYYLLGASRKIPPIFDGIAWSTGQVWQSTLERLEAANIDFQTLQPWYDVDRLEDLNRLMNDLVDTEEPHLLWLRDRLQELISH